MTKTPAPRPRAVMLSKRANIFYLEHVRVIQKSERVVYLTDSEQDVERFFNIPEKNTAFLLLGKGTSITDAAARKLAESNVVVGFCGSGGSPLFGALDIAFLAPQSEYRPTQYMQAWVQAWMTEGYRLGRRLLVERAKTAEVAWREHPDLLRKGVVIPSSLLERFRADIGDAQSDMQLLTAEARWAKKLYALLARTFDIEFTRDEGKRSRESVEDVINGFLDHGNYIAYGFAAVALNGLGISFSLPVLHGKTRRGALVFDVADLIKDAYVMPLAFAAGKRGDSQKEFREQLIDRCQTEEVLDYLFTFIERLCQEITEKQAVTV
jgi:CRISP-associated protein Cas1